MSARCPTCSGFGCPCCTRSVDASGQPAIPRHAVCRYSPCPNCGGTGEADE